MENEDNIGYEGKFWFGNPPQEMKVLFDTGSNWVWMFSDKCTPETCPAENKKYESSKSSSYRLNSNQTKVFNYGGGAAVRGNIARDRGFFS